jgi:hypothetical protein
VAWQELVAVLAVKQMDYTPLIYTSFGAIIGFITNYIMNTYRRKYELKKQIYFEVLDHVAKARKINEDLLADGTEVPKWMHKLDIEPYKSWFITYELLQFKLDVIDGKKIKELMRSICDYPFQEGADNLTILYDDLIQTMRQELDTSWWQLWR